MLTVDGNAFGMNRIALCLGHGWLVQIVTCSYDMGLRNIRWLMQRLLVAGSRHWHSVRNHDRLMNLLRLVALNHSCTGYNRNSLYRSMLLLLSNELLLRG